MQGHGILSVHGKLSGLVAALSTLLCFATPLLTLPFFLNNTTVAAEFPRNKLNTQPCTVTRCSADALPANCTLGSLLLGLQYTGDPNVQPCQPVCQVSKPKACCRCCRKGLSLCLAQEQQSCQTYSSNSPQQPSSSSKSRDGHRWAVVTAVTAAAVSAGGSWSGKRKRWHTYAGPHHCCRCIGGSRPHWQATVHGVQGRKVLVP
jgi:hypothetical protein